ncbi:kelch-like protein 12 [Ciona intestinalis]
MTSSSDVTMTSKLRSISLSGTTEVTEVTRTSDHGDNVLGFANKIRHTNLFNDVTIVADNRRFPTNRMILATYSKYFERLFISQLTLDPIVNLDDVDAQSVGLLIEFMYTKHINININNVCEVLAAADLLEVQSAKDFCLEFLGRAISVQNCFTIQSISRQYSCDELTTQVNVFISEHFDIVTQQEDFKKLSNNDVDDCLGHVSNLDVSTESMYTALVSWVTHDVEERRSHLSRLTPHINFNQLSPQFLQKEVLSERLIRNDLDCMNRVCDAISGHLNRFSKRDHATRFIYIGGTETLCDVIMYDPSGKKRTILPNLVNGRDVACAAMVGCTLFFIGGDLNVGGKESPSNAVDCLKMDDDNLFWVKAAPMNVKRVLAGCAVINDTIFVVGGHKKNQYLSSGEFYSPVFDTWEMIANMKQSRHGHALVACKGRLYAIGGHGGKHYLSSVERYDPIVGEWSDVAPMHSPRCWPCAVVINDVIYVIGGRSDRDMTLRSVEMYDVSKDIWCHVSEMKRYRCAFGACVVNGKIFAIGGLGFDGSTERSTESYNPVNDEWKVTETFPAKLYNHCVTSW